MKYTKFNKRYMMFRVWSIHPCFAAKDGPSLRPNDGRKHNWSDLNGFFICLPNSSRWYEFRRSSFHRPVR